MIPQYVWLPTVNNTVTDAGDGKMNWVAAVEVALKGADKNQMHNTPWKEMNHWFEENYKIIETVDPKLVP